MNTKTEAALDSSTSKVHGDLRKRFISITSSYIFEIRGIKRQVVNELHCTVNFQPINDKLFPMPSAINENY